MKWVYKWSQVVALIALFGTCLYLPPQAQAGASSRTFRETGQTVQGRFLEYWETHGGLMQQGYPISPELQERSEIDGKLRTVQYFERAVFEWNPENVPPYNVLLAHLGTFAYNGKGNRVPTLLEPAVPPPAKPDNYQLYPQASGRYLVWNEGKFSGGGSSGGRFPYEFDIRALDLATNEAFTVIDAPKTRSFCR